MWNLPSSTAKEVEIHKKPSSLLSSLEVSPLGYSLSIKESG